MVTPAPSSASASAPRRSARPAANSGRSPTGNSRCSGTRVQRQERRGEDPGYRRRLGRVASTERREQMRGVERGCRTAGKTSSRKDLMRTFRLRPSHPALVLLLAALSTACNIVSSPPSVDSPLYVANSGSASIAIYAPFTNGNQAPSRTISGGNTMLASPSGVTLNAAGELFVANSSAKSITVYALGATGNAAPTSTISGASTGLANPIGVGLDGTGNLYVANSTGVPNSITVYAPGASGNIAPTSNHQRDQHRARQPTGRGPRSHREALRR